MRLVIALYAMGLLIFPAWGLVSPEAYRAELVEDFHQAEAAALPQLQLAAGLHWLKNAYLAFTVLMLARYLGPTGQPGNLQRAGLLFTVFPVILLVFQVLSQIALSPDADDLDLRIRLSSEWLLYAIVGLSLLGIARTLPAKAPTSAPAEEPTP